MKISLKVFHISGAGNSFSLISIKQFLSQNSLISEAHFASWVKEKGSIVAQTVCQKSQTDGFIFLDTAKLNQLKWYFYNNDGSEAEMCGNATRTVGHFLKSIEHRVESEFDLQTMAGLIHIKDQSAGLYTITMTPIEKYEHAHYFWCDTGVPHIVINLNQFENKGVVPFDSYKDLKVECRELRFFKDFLPRGTNVTLIEKSSTNNNRLKAVTYERGVEDFTLACGTGAVAAAFYNLEYFNCHLTYVEMPGGLLTLNLENINKPLMTGEAKLMGEDFYEIEI